jgi:hypothetical protein
MINERINKTMVYEIIKDLEAEPSKNAKLEIIKANDSVLLRQFFLMALNPHMNFGIKKIPEYDKAYRSPGNDFDGGSLLGEAMAQLYKLHNRELTGNAAIAFLKSMLESLSPEHADLIERIIRKEAGCGVSYKTVNKVWKKLIPAIGYMRCASANDKNYARINYPAQVDKKANGLFLNIIIRSNEVEAETRNGKPLLLHGCLDELAKIMPNRDVVIHGEGLVLKEGRKMDDEYCFLDRQTGNGIINKAIQGTISIEEAGRIVIEAWDLVLYEHWVEGKSGIEFDNRFSMLESAISLVNPEKLMVIEHRKVNSFAEAAKFYSEMLQRGEEGAVLKNLNGLWKNHTSPNQVKMKIKDPADLLCVGTYAHSKTSIKRGSKTIDTSNWIGGLNLESADGIIKVNTGSGLVDADRAKDPSEYIGKIIELEYNEITYDKSTGQKSLFLPIFQGIRVDKDEADDYETILERSTYSNHPK